MHIKESLFFIEVNGSKKYRYLTRSTMTFSQIKFPY